jgi:hypothetical protein
MSSKMNVQTPKFSSSVNNEQFNNIKKDILKSKLKQEIKFYNESVKMENEELRGYYTDPALSNGSGNTD